MHIGRPGCRWEDNIKTDLREDEAVWTGLIRLEIETNDGLF
jgi:hypothetical protein